MPMRKTNNEIIKEYMTMLDYKTLLTLRQTSY